MAVEVQDVRTGAVAFGGNSAVRAQSFAICAVRQMAGTPDIIQCRLRIAESGDNRSPSVMFVVQQIGRVGRLRKRGHLAHAKLLVTDVVLR